MGTSKHAMGTSKHAMRTSKHARGTSKYARGTSKFAKGTSKVVRGTDEQSTKKDRLLMTRYTNALSNVVEVQEEIVYRGLNAAEAQQVRETANRRPRLFERSSFEPALEPFELPGDFVQRAVEKQVRDGSKEKTRLISLTKSLSVANAFTTFGKNAGFMVISMKPIFSSFALSALSGWVD